MPSEAPSSAALRPTLALSSPSLARLESLGLQASRFFPSRIAKDLRVWVLRVSV